MAAFIHGMLLCLGLIIPLGIQNVFILNQGVNQPRLYLALPSVLTAFVCDSTLIVLAILGVSLVVLQFVWLKVTLLIVGFLFLMLMGFLTWRSKAHTIEAEQKAFSVKRQIYFAASVSLLNPHAIIDTVGVIGTNALNYCGHHKWLFGLGCMMMSLVWFIGLTTLGNLLRKFNQKVFLYYLNKISAIIIWGIAFYMLWLLIKDHCLG